MTTVAIHQPQYLPLLPYCDKADNCDVFVYLDTVQFQKNGVQNRNQIKTASGATWLTVPVSVSLGDTIAETSLASNSFARKHLATIKQSYARAEFKELLMQPLECIFSQSWSCLAELNIAITELLFENLRIKSKRIRASELDVAGSKDDLILAICRSVGADVYFSGKGAQSYQDEEKFRHHGVTLRYQEYKAPEYRQCFPELGFVPDLSALDLLLNMGQESRAVMISGRKIA